MPSLITIFNSFVCLKIRKIIMNLSCTAYREYTVLIQHPADIALFTVINNLFSINGHDIRRSDIIIMLCFVYYNIQYNLPSVYY